MGNEKNNQALEFLNKDFTLENKAVLLRHIVKEDFELFKEIAFDDNIWKYFTSNVSNEADLHFFIDEAIQQRDAGARVPFTIVDKSSGKVIGSTSYGNISPVHQRVEVGWTWVSPKFQKTGLNRNCKFLLMKYVFENMQWMRLEFKTDVLNEQARKGLLGAGATEEGVLRSHTLMPFNRRRDTIYYSVLASEWSEVKNNVYSGY